MELEDILPIVTVLFLGSAALMLWVILAWITFGHAIPFFFGR